MLSQSLLPLSLVLAALALLLLLLAEQTHSNGIAHNALELLRAQPCKLGHHAINTKRARSSSFISCRGTPRLVLIADEPASGFVIVDVVVIPVAVIVIVVPRLAAARDEPTPSRSSVRARALRPHT